MTEAGDKLLNAAKEALAVAKGEQPAASVWINGHEYVPATRLRAEVAEARRAGMREAAEIARNTSFMMPIDWWMQSSKKEVSVESCLQVAAAIEARAEGAHTRPVGTEDSA